MSKDERSRMMSRIKSANTKPERELRHYLWEQGFRYRINVRSLPGTPDIVLPKYKTAIFVHGCFWHGHDCKDYRLPKTNTDFWQQKVTANRKRDEESARKLSSLGWNVITVWECELKTRVFEATAARVVSDIVGDKSTI